MSVVPEVISAHRANKSLRSLITNMAEGLSDVSFHAQTLAAAELSKQNFIILFAASAQNS